LTEPETSLIKQYIALLGTEEVRLVFDDGAIAEVASLAADINSTVENIGARRLQTVLEKLLEDISFDASDKPGTEYPITAEMVREKVGVLAKDADLSRFIL
jgi:ATP-dependent HslUV protease ATP-binding subunit HslU